MSAYITLATPMVDEECLAQAIVDLGFERAKLVRSPTPVPLRGWQAGRSAHIVLRQEDTGNPRGDIGFVRHQVGYVAVLSDDAGRFGREWLTQVNERYSLHWSAKQDRLAEEERMRLERERQLVVESQRQAVYERARKMGYSVKESREGQTIRLVLVKRSY